MGGFLGIYFNRSASGVRDWVECGIPREKPGTARGEQCIFLRLVIVGTTNALCLLRTIIER